MQENGESTASGRLAAKFPLDPIWYRAIEEATRLGCGMNIVDIAVLCITQKSIFARPAGFEQVADIQRAVFGTTHSDHMALVNAFNRYLHVREKHEQEDGPQFDLELWCKRHFLHKSALEAAYDARDKLGPLLQRTAMLTATHASIQDKTAVKKALARALRTQIAFHYLEPDQYQTLHEGVVAQLDPCSCLVNQRAEWIVYTNLQKVGGRVYMEYATQIDAEFLVVSTMG